MQEKSPEELSRQKEIVLLMHALDDRDPPENPDEFTESLREIRKSDGPAHDAETLEKLRENTETAVSLGIEHALLESQIAGEGNYGIVFKVPIDAIDGPARRILHHEEILVEEPQAVKVLKNGTSSEPGQAPSNVNEKGDATPTSAQERHRQLKLLKLYSNESQREYEMLRRANEIIQETGTPELYAKVPAAHGARTVMISPVIKKFLEDNGIKGKHIGEKAELIFMEFVDGKDLATHIFEFVLRRSNFQQEQINEMTMAEKINLAAVQLGYVMPGGRGKSQGDRDFEFWKVGNENIDKLVVFLSKHVGAPDFPITREMLDKIERTVRLMNDKNLFHNDLHERNIMVGADGEVYIIDFGRADTTTEDAHVADDAVIKRRFEKVFERTPQALEAKKEAAITAEVERKKAAATEGVLKRHYERLKEAYTKGEGVAEDYFLLIVDGLGENGPEALVGIVARVLEEIPARRRKALRGVAEHFVDSYIEAKRAQVARQNKLRALRTIGLWK